MSSKFKQTDVLEVSKDMQLDPNQILIAEFNYISQTAFQATEDRVRVFSFVLANIGTFFGTIFLPNISGIFNPLFFSGLFLILTIFGIMSLFKLAKLRIAWLNSVKAMLQIKEFYIKHVKSLPLDEAFRWKIKTLPKADKKWSVAFLMALTTMFVNSISGIASLYLFLLYTSQQQILIASLLFGLLLFLLQLFAWFKLVKEK